MSQAAEEFATVELGDKRLNKGDSMPFRVELDFTVCRW